MADTYVDPERIRKHYQGLTDFDLARQYELGPSGFSSQQVWEIVQAEFRARNAPLVQEQAASRAGIGQPRSIGTLIHRLWQGDVSLPWTYWFYGAFISLLLLYLLATIENAAAAREWQPRVWVAFAVAVDLSFLAYLGLVIVAIWRSAGRYGGPQAWAVLARATVVLGVMLMVLAFFRALLP